MSSPVGLGGSGTPFLPPSGPDRDQQPSERAGDEQKVGRRKFSDLTFLQQIPTAVVIGLAAIFTFGTQVKAASKFMRGMFTPDFGKQRHQEDKMEGKAIGLAKAARIIPETPETAPPPNAGVWDFSPLPLSPTPPPVFEKVSSDAFQESEPLTELLSSKNVSAVELRSAESTAADAMFRAVALAIGNDPSEIQQKFNDYLDAPEKKDTVDKWIGKVADGSFNFINVARASEGASFKQLCTNPEKREEVIKLLKGEESAQKILEGDKRLLDKLRAAILGEALGQKIHIHDVIIQRNGNLMVRNVNQKEGEINLLIGLQQTVRIINPKHECDELKYKLGWSNEMPLKDFVNDTRNEGDLRKIYQEVYKTHSHRPTFKEFKEALLGEKFREPWTEFDQRGLDRGLVKIAEKINHTTYSVKKTVEGDRGERESQVGTPNGVEEMAYKVHRHLDKHPQTIELYLPPALLVRGG